jgi:hypothetical protein
MKRPAPFVVVIALVAATSFVSLPAWAGPTALERVAKTLGYTYNYLGPEDAVALTRPGVTVVIRPGERLFDVNDRTEAMNGPAPAFENDDVYVSDALVSRLRAIAATYRTVLVHNERVALHTYGYEAEASAVTGAITDLHVTQVRGQQALSVVGKSRANLPITISLVSTMSAELPDTVLCRERVTTDAHGMFDIDVPVAPGYFRGSIITVVASSYPGVAKATSRIEMRAPNQDLQIPADEIPRSIR